ncbi:MAG: DUF4445 domain-containing protein [Lachnospiraceae bacterium]|nr:DUF4445 domain-containing protein [Lachnospiraceae bacterium]
MEKENIRLEIKGEGAFSLKKGENVLSVLIGQNLFVDSHCGGHGTCGKCAVRFTSGAPLPLPGDRRRFSPQQLREGWRLACLAKPKQDCALELGFTKKDDFILDKTLFGRCDKECALGNEPAGADSDGQDMKTMVVADLGSTTIVLQLVESRTGKIIDTYKTMNPQRKYGADVITRMEHALAGKKQELSDLVNDCLEEAVLGWKQRGYHPERILLAGNTVMVHLLMGYETERLAKAPFVPVTTQLCSFEAAGTDAVTLPGISAFVGGDITAGIYVCKELMQKESVQRALLIDLGTNGEMAFLTPERILCTATAAGPAFEGGFGSCIYGSDVIAVAADLLEKGIADETGLMAEPYFTDGYRDGNISVYQEDIRSLQMAKAAVFAGIRILLEKEGMKAGDVQRVYLAGGFGYKLSVEAACRIGLIPSVWRERTVAVGNTALAGAYIYGKTESDTSVTSGNNAEEMLQKCESINLAECDNFNTYYLQAMELKEERDLS